MRINITAGEGVGELEALVHVMQVVQGGKISMSKWNRPCYCFVTTFGRGQGLTVYAELTEAGHHTFRVEGKGKSEATK